jgi:hypothetical protein
MERDLNAHSSWFIKKAKIGAETIHLLLIYE